MDPENLSENFKRYSCFQYKFNFVFIKTSYCIKKTFFFLLLDKTPNYQILSFKYKINAIVGNVMVVNIGNAMYLRSPNYRSLRDSFTMENYVEIYTYSDD